MRRAEINEIIKQAQSFIEGFGYVLPPFAHWTPEDWDANRAEAGAIVDAALGWDITDYGLGQFEETGLFLFTVRNGNEADLRAGSGMLYAEKIMISRRDQLSPMHYHRVKAEDIINRGGATLAIQLYGSDAQGGFDDSAGGTVRCDGIERPFAAGEVLKLSPGESVTLMPGDWHAFWGDGGDVLIGEVSTVNDDLTDNVFRDPIGRFADIEEDEAPTHLLVSDYDTWLR